MAYKYDENGNYKRSVRCSWCYNVGHSQRACPDRFPNGTPAQQRARKREEEKAQRKEAREQRKLDKAAGIKVAKVPRKCGYCKEYGHMRRHCETLTADKARLVEVTLDYRNKLVDEVVSQGIGQGALVASKVREWSNRENDYVSVVRYAMITRTNFEAMTPYNNWAISKRDMLNWNQIGCLSMLNLNGDRYHMGQRTEEAMLQSDEAGSFSGEASSKYSQRTGRAARVVVPGEVSLPDGFLDEDKVAAEVEEYFSNKTKTREHYNILDRVQHNDNDNQ